MYGNKCVVISTHGSTPYVHLSLENIRRKHIDIDIIVHDDSSKQQKQLIYLCELYNAKFVSTEKPLGHFAGDLAAINYGISLNNYDYFIKLSRRFIPIDIISDFIQAFDPSINTYSSICQKYNILRTECIGFNIKKWKQHIIDLSCANIQENCWNFVEEIVYKYSNNIQVMKNLGNNRHERSDKFLWHDWAKPEDYLKLSNSCGLKYTQEEFFI